jgi:hypothetical protein
MIRLTSSLFWFSLAIIASIALYRTSDHVQQLNHDLATTNAAIEAEQKSIHVLKAEWVYLANPTRIEAMAKKHMTNLNATPPERITSMANVASVIPPRGAAPAPVAVVSAAVATTKVAVAVHKPQIVTLHRVTVAAAKVPATVSVRAKPTAVASNTSGHLTDHMMMQHTASTYTGHDQIGAMLAQLDQNP